MDPRTGRRARQLVVASTLALCALLTGLVSPIIATGAPSRLSVDQVLPSTTRPDAPAKSGELIVRFKPGVSHAERAEVLAAAGAELVESYTPVDMGLAKVDPEASDAVLKELEADPRVAYVEPNYLVTAYADGKLPDDPQFHQQWGLDNQGQWAVESSGTADADIDAPEAWQVTTGSASVVVGIIDTGVDFGHPDLGGSMKLSPRMWVNQGENCENCQFDGVDNDGNGYVDDWRGWDFVNDDNNPYDDNGHGTHVAGILGGSGNNGVGGTGVNWNVTIMALKFLDANGGGSVSDAVEAIMYAISMGVRVTNNSWGSGVYSQALADAIAAADEAGMLVVAAAGNESSNTDDFASYPAGYDFPNVISVGASDNNDANAWFSNFGVRSVDLHAPGLHIYSSYVPDGIGRPYTYLSGTSMATPHVTGVAALALARFPDVDDVALRALLMRTVDPVAALAGLNATGGRLNADHVVRCEQDAVVWIEQPTTGFAVGTGQPVEIRAIAGSCASADGVSVTAGVSGTPVTLEARGDGLFTGTFTPDTPGPITIEVTARAAGDSDAMTVSGAAVQNYRVQNVDYEWIDASDSGTQTAIVEDDGTETVTLPFPFTFYDKAFSDLQISANGYVVFGGGTARPFANEPIPDPSNPNGIVAPFWDDLNPSAGGTIWYRTVGEAPNRRFVVAWLGVPHYNRIGDSTFELILDEASNAITFQYADVEFEDNNLDFGGSATIGVEHPAGTIGREFSFLEESLVLYQGQRGIRFTLAALGEPTITTFVLPNATLNLPYSAPIEVTDGTEPFSWSVVGGTLPAGLALNPATGTIEGTPSQAGVFSFTVQVTDSAGHSITQLLSIEVVIGYSFADVPFEWVDARDGGTNAMVPGDDTAVPVELPFAFIFYGQAFTSLQISSNGFLKFGEGSATKFSNTELPNTDEPNGIVAPFWDDLSPHLGGGVWFKTVGEAPNRRFVVAWIDAPHYKETGAATFEVILEEGSNGIVFQYLDTNFEFSVYDFGKGATIGVENLTGTAAAQFSFNEAVLQAYDGQKGIRFVSGAPVDQRPQITSTPPSDAEIGQPYEYQAEATGAAPLTWSLDKAPEGMTVDPETGLVTWTPTEPGIYDVSLVVSNASGSDVQEWQINVSAVPIGEAT